MSCVGGSLAGGKYVVLMWAANREYNGRPQERWRRQKEGAKHNSPADGFDDMLNKVENMETWQTHISFYEQGHIRHTWGVNGSQDFCVMDTHTGERESLPLFSRKRSAIPLMESSDYSPDRCDDGAGGEGENAFFRTRPHVVYPFTNVEMCTGRTSLLLCATASAVVTFRETRTTTLPLLAGCEFLWKYTCTIIILLCGA